MSKKWLSALLAGMMLASCMPAMASAEGTDADAITIASSEDLVAAIKGQADGQTWVFTKEGEYNVYNAENYREDKTGLPATDMMIGGYVTDQVLNYEAEYVFPIYADDITIKKADGVGDVTVTSTARPAKNYGGMGNYQNFITIAGEGVTIDGINVKANINDYYEGSNKVIEVLGKDASLLNMNLLRLEGEGNGSGNIILNGEDIGTATITNLTMFGWISANYAKAGTLNATDVTIDYTDNAYAGYKDETYGYGWNPGIFNSREGCEVVVNNKNLTIKVDGDINLTEQVFTNALQPNTTVVLTEDVAVDKMVDIAKDGITLDLGGNTLTASENFTGAENYENDKHLVNVTGEKVTVKNGTLKATADNKHVLNVYEAGEAALEDVVLDHTAGFKGAPLVVNGSSVTVSGELKMITGEKSWYAANVDNKTDSTGADTTLVFADNAKVVFEGKSQIGISLETSKEDAKVTVDFGKNISVSAPDEFAVVVKAEEANAEIKNPENADLAANEDGVLVEKAPVITAGADSTWKTDSTEGLSFTSDAQFAEFIKVTVDGKDVAAENYEVKAGSTVVTLKVDYLKTLAEGKHTLAIVSENGAAETSFTVEAADVPEKPVTGDNSVMLWMTLVLMAAAGFAGMRVFGKKAAHSR